MRLALSDLVCPACRSYVHPFLDLCPACGTRRTSLYGAALADRVGDPSLAEDRDLARAAAEAGTKYALLTRRGGALGAVTSDFLADHPEAPPLDELVDQVVSSLTYRTIGLLPDRSDAADAGVRVRAEGVQFRGSRGNTLLVVDPALILAATPLPRGAAGLERWAGIVTLEGSVCLPRPTIQGDGALLTFRDQDGYRQVSVGNRRGLLASKAKSSHYDDFSRWLGTLAASAAQARWRSIGADAYAIELGLRAGI